jgi:hypothetical protein
MYFASHRLIGKMLGEELCCQMHLFKEIPPL